MATSYPARELGPLSTPAEVTRFDLCCHGHSQAKEGRILRDKWNLYDIEHVTFVPKGMNPEKLQEGFEWLNASFLSWGSIFRRSFKPHCSLQIFGPMNFGFRKAWKKQARITFFVE
jgi:hypothetical protein